MGKQQVGKLSSRALEKRYWRGAGEDLVTLGYAERAQRRKGCLQWYRILKAFPTAPCDLDAEIREHYTRSILEWFDAVEGEVNELKDEMGEWRGNMQGTGLESTEKYQEVEEAEDNLDTVVASFAALFGFVDAKPNLKDLNVAVDPKALSSSCSHRAKRKRMGRHWRAQEVCNILRAIEKTVREQKTADRQVAEFADLIHSLIGEVEEVDFPSAF